MTFSAIFDPTVRAYFKKKYGGSDGNGGVQYIVSEKGTYYADKPIVFGELVKVSDLTPTEKQLINGVIIACDTNVAYGHILLTEDLLVYEKDIPLFVAGEGALMLTVLTQEVCDKLASYGEFAEPGLYVRSKFFMSRESDDNWYFNELHTCLIVFGA